MASPRGLFLALGIPVNFLKTALMGFGGLLLVLVLLTVISAIYSSVWQDPHAKKASAEFAQTVVPGMTETEVRAIATRLGASDLHITPESANTEKDIDVSFYAFPGGEARYYCTVHFFKGRAKQAECGFDG